jgi:hypothetical protein
VSGIVALLGFAALVLGVVWIVLSWLTGRAKHEYQAAAIELTTLAALPADEARRQAQVALGRPEIFKCVESPVDPDTLPQSLAQQLRGFLSRYEGIETATGPMMVVDRAHLSLPAMRLGFLPIGTGMPGTDVEYQIAVREGSEEIAELHGGEAPDATFGTYPTIYHWILAAASEVEEARKSAVVTGG